MASHPAALQRLRSQLKDWEHTFARLHRRPPSKTDILASPSIHELYKEYACLKQQQRKESAADTFVTGKLFSERGKENLGHLSLADLGSYAHRQNQAQPSSPRNDASYSNESQGTHISATPPKKRKFSASQVQRHGGARLSSLVEDDSMRALGGEAGIDTSERKTYQSHLRVLATVSSNRQTSPKNRAGRMLSKSTPQKLSRQCQKQHLPDSMSNQCDNFERSRLTSPSSGLGFTIKLQRHGELKESTDREIENLPQGFFLNCSSSFRAGKKFLSGRTAIRDQSPEIGKLEVTAEDSCVKGADSAERLVQSTRGAVFFNDMAINGQLDQNVPSVLTNNNECIEAPANLDEHDHKMERRPLGNLRRKKKNGRNEVLNCQSQSESGHATFRDSLLCVRTENPSDLAARTGRITRSTSKMKTSQDAIEFPTNLDEHNHKIERGPFESLKSKKKDGRNKVRDCQRQSESGHAIFKDPCVRKDNRGDLVVRTGRMTRSTSTMKISQDSSLVKGDEVELDCSHLSTGGKHHLSCTHKRAAAASDNCLKQQRTQGIMDQRFWADGEVISSASGDGALMVNPVQSKRGNFARRPKRKQHSETFGLIKVSDSLVDSRADTKALEKAIKRKCTSGFAREHPRSGIPGSSLRRVGRENFVKLNINGKSRKAYRFVNRTHKAMHAQRPYRGKGLKKRKTVSSSVKHDTDRSVVEELDMDIDGNLLETADTDFVSGITGNKTSSACQSSVIEELHSQAQICAGVTAGNTLDTSTAMAVKKTAIDALANPTEEHLLHVLHMVFGYNSFRPGQLETIQRVLTQQCTMLLSPTGSGKSLCYQFPAFLLPGITLVVSPLLALMMDQLRHLPSLLPGAVISCSQTSEEISLILQRLRSGEVKVLFVSPERFLNESFLLLLEDLSSISLAVVDEAHCLSEWSHNFRPSYFRLGSVLSQRLKAKCILAMTATATKRTLQSIMHSLSIPPAGIVQISHIRENLHFSVSWSDNRLKDLLSLLQSSPFLEAQSIIIYCKFQFEADNVSRFLCDNRLQAKSYHGGMTSTNRNRIQDLFCSDKLRIVVATVAFGLGLDKSNVRVVIHFGLPNSLEHYVQETGRAGRDGEPAHCHLFLENNTFLKLRSLVYSESVDEYALRKFLYKIFEGFSAQSNSGQVNSFLVEPTSTDLDMKEEVMATVLSYLEVCEAQYVRVLPQLKATCAVGFYKKFPALLAEKNALINAIVKRSQSKHGQYVFNVPSLAKSMGIAVSDVQQELRELQSNGDISYQLSDPAFCFDVLKDPEDLSGLASKVSAWLKEVENLKVKKLDFMFTAAAAAAQSARQDATNLSMQSSLQGIFKNYFELDEEQILVHNAPSIVKTSSPFLRADIKVFLQTNSHARFTGKAIARLFHGLWSPAFPSSIWSKNHFWARYMACDFNAIEEAATREILACRLVKL